MVFCDWLLSLNFSRFIHVTTWISTSFLFIAEQYPTVQIYHILFFHLSADGHLDCFYFFTILNKAAMNIHVYVFLWMWVFISIGYIPRSGTAGSYGNSMFNFLRSYQTFPWKMHYFQISHFHLQPILSYSCSLPSSLGLGFAWCTFFQPFTFNFSVSLCFRCLLYLLWLLPMCLDFQNSIFFLLSLWKLYSLILVFIKV